MNNGGLLLISASENGNTIRNILAVVLNPISRQENRFPLITKITFIENNTLDHIRLNGETYKLWEGYEKILGSLGLSNIEVRRRKIENNEVDIPNLVVSAVHEVGKNNLIIDLTSGMKDITGPLYTSATLCDICNVIYIEVKRDSNNSFYTLDLESNDINEKINVRRFRAIEEMQNLASLNSMEFIIYKKILEDLLIDCDSAKFQMFCLNLSAAIEQYFSSQEFKYKDCIRSVGIACEDITGRIKKYLLLKIDKEIHTKAEDKYKSKDTIEICNKYFLDLSRGKVLNKEDKSSFQVLSKYFRFIPSIHYMIKTIRTYRNIVSHNIQIDIHREDAKIVLETMLTMVQGLHNAGFLYELFKEEATD